ncbi:MAG: methylated-DNA--[protein]-cysteine S-methyltransferase [Desulfurococcales archaeon]|jgi:methylated-DNA-[protein]-cysteine S-methyltransferase|nr:methylated-DNA--[protein]-cysteine S-methyltransferase [Desulfurococcales archaeon]
MRKRIRRETLEEIVYTLLQLIPMGKVSTYKSLSKIVGVHPRVIGYILGRNKDLITTPCHRVVYKDGRIGGYSLGTNFKKRLLELEGVEIEEDDKIPKRYIIDLAKELLEK